MKDRLSLNEAYTEVELPYIFEVVLPMPAPLVDGMVMDQVVALYPASRNMELIVVTFEVFQLDKSSENSVAL